MHTLKPDSLELSHSWTFAAAVPIYMPFDTEMCNMQTQKVMLLHADSPAAEYSTSSSTMLDWLF